MFFAKNLKYLRDKKNLTQTYLANVLKVSRGTIAMWETKRREPDLRTLVDIADYFQVSLDDLILRDLTPPEPICIKNIKFLCKKHDMTQEDMSGLLGFKNRSGLCLVGKGKIKLSGENLEKIADYFGITLDQLVKEDLSKGVK